MCVQDRQASCPLRRLDAHCSTTPPTHPLLRIKTHLLVVPVAFLPVLRAEQTTTIRLFLTHSLRVQTSAEDCPQCACLIPLAERYSPAKKNWPAPYLTISSAILSGNLPTLVPPNFCTIQPLVLAFLSSDPAIALRH